MEGIERIPGIWFACKWKEKKKNQNRAREKDFTVKKEIPDGLSDKNIFS